MKKATAHAKGHDGGADLRSIGKRLERLMRERELADRLRVEAGAAFEKSAPKITSSYANFNNSVVKAWDALLDPGETVRPLSMEDHWKIVQHIFDIQERIPFAALKSMAKKSRYAAAAARVRLIDVEIKGLASRALKIRAAKSRRHEIAGTCAIGLRSNAVWLAVHLRSRRCTDAEPLGGCPEQSAGGARMSAIPNRRGLLLGAITAGAAVTVAAIPAIAAAKQPDPVFGVIDALQAAEACIEEIRDIGDHAAYEEACRAADAAFDELTETPPVTIPGMRALLVPYTSHRRGKPAR